MKRRTLLQTIPAVAALPMTGWARLLENSKLAPMGAAGHDALGREEMAEARGMADRAGEAGPVYELRVYHTYQGKLDDLLRRFRDHTMQLFARHGIKNVAYWLPTDEPLKGKTLVYMLEHPGREAATANWKAFQNDPEWQRVRDESEKNGKLVEKVDSTFMALTDFSPKIR